jgi:hypothetical protein
MVVADDHDTARLFELIVDHSDRSALVVGMGNIGEQGLEIARYFGNRSRIQSRITNEPVSDGSRVNGGRPKSRALRSTAMSAASNAWDGTSSADPRVNEGDQHD